MMEDILIENAQYVASNGENKNVVAVIAGELLTVPLDTANRHYAEIMRQVEAGTLTIAEASAE